MPFLNSRSADTFVVFIFSRRFCILFLLKSGISDRLRSYRNFDLGGVSGCKGPLTKNINLEARVSVNFTDITNDNHRAANP